MAIDARIDAVIQDGDDYILQLQPTITSDGKATIRGVRELRIVRATHRPRPGQTIWGGTDAVVIEPGFGVVEQKWYRRVGYTMLTEKYTDDCARCGALAVGVIEGEPLCNHCASSSPGERRARASDE